MNIFKRAFTLAEILVVLTVIGVIASITIPQLTGGVDEAQYKAGYKKAYSTIANIVAIMKADDMMPTGNNEASVANVWQAICENIEVDGVGTSANSVNIGTKMASSDILPGWTYAGINCGDVDAGSSSNNYHSAAQSPWIIAPDGMAYTILTGGGCGTKGTINKSTTTAATAWSSACVAVVVDVNGVEKLPNKMEPQTTTLTSTTKLKKLTGDRYYIYIAKDGVAKGSELLTITGRMLAGVK